MLSRKVPLPLAALLLLSPTLACLRASGDLADAQHLRCQQRAMTQASILECRRVLSMQRPHGMPDAPMRSAHHG